MSSTAEHEAAVKEPSKVDLFEETLRELKKNVDQSTAAFAKIEAAVSEFKQMQEANNQRWNKLKQISEEIKEEGDAAAKEILKLAIEQETRGDERTPDGKFKLVFRGFDFKGSNHQEIISNSVVIKDAWWHMVVSNIKGKELVLYCDRFVEGNEPYEVIFEVKGKDKPWCIAMVREKTPKTVYISSFLQLSDGWIQHFIKKFVIDGVAEINVFFEEIKNPFEKSIEPHVQPNTVRIFQFQLSHLNSIFKHSGDEVFSSQVFSSQFEFQYYPSSYSEARYCYPKIYITKLNGGSFCIHVWWPDKNAMMNSTTVWQMLLSTTERIPELKVGRKFQTVQDKDPNKSITIPAELISSGELEGFVVEIVK